MSLKKRTLRLKGFKKVNPQTKALKELKMPSLEEMALEDPVELYRHIWKVDNGNKYAVMKTIDGKIMGFGTFKTKAEALFEKYLLVALDWDLETLCAFPTSKPPFTDDDLPEFPTFPRTGLCASGRTFGFRGVTIATNLRENAENVRAWNTQIRYNYNTKHLASCIDPLSGELIYKFVKEELRKFKEDELNGEGINNY